jgi:hypothetical protein
LLVPTSRAGFDRAVRLNAEVVRHGDCPVESARALRGSLESPNVTAADAQAEAAARRLWERAAAATAPDGDAFAITDRVLVELEHGLRRWVGAEGYSALLQRATALTLPAHPALARIEDLGTRPMSVRVEPASDDVIRAAVVALLAALMELLGRIIGFDMAMRLVEKLGQPSPRGIVSIAPEEPRDE